MFLINESVIADIYFLKQATIAEPLKGKMFKGLLVCYTIVISCYFSVQRAIGNQVEIYVLQNFMVGSNPPLPKWFLLMTNGSSVLQVAACSLVSFSYFQGKNYQIIYFMCYDNFSCYNNFRLLGFRRQFVHLVLRPLF